MNGVIGEYEVSRNQILAGNHHIITAFPVKDGITGLKCGMLAVKDDDGDYVPLQKVYADKNPVAVFLENTEGETSGSVVPVAIHGAVRLAKLQFSDGSPITDAEIELLRSVGIYAI